MLFLDFFVLQIFSFCNVARRRCRSLKLLPISLKRKAVDRNIFPRLICTQMIDKLARGNAWIFSKYTKDFAACKNHFVDKYRAAQCHAARPSEQFFGLPYLSALIVHTGRVIRWRRHILAGMIAPIHGALFAVPTAHSAICHSCFLLGVISAISLCQV